MSDFELQSLLAHAPRPETPDRGHHHIPRGGRGAVVLARVNMAGSEGYAAAADQGAQVIRDAGLDDHALAHVVLTWGQCGAAPLADRADLQCVLRLCATPTVRWVEVRDLTCLTRDRRCFVEFHDAVMSQGVEIRFASQDSTSGISSIPDAAIEALGARAAAAWRADTARVLQTISCRLDGGFRG